MSQFKSYVKKTVFLIAFIGALYHLYLVIHPFMPFYISLARIGILNLEQLQKATHLFFILIIGYMYISFREYAIRSIGVRWCVALATAILTLIIHYQVILLFSGDIILQISLTFIWILAFLTPIVEPVIKNASRYIMILEILLAIYSFVPYIYLVIHFEEFVARATSPEMMDIAMGWSLLMLVMGLALRYVGPEMPLLTTLFILYVLYGYIFPRPWTHPGFDVGFLIAKIYVEPEAAIFGLITRVSLLYIVYYTILTGLFSNVGFGNRMASLMLSLLRERSVNVGRIAIALGSVMGMISGSGAADTAYVGSTLKEVFLRAGYSAEVAAGISANAGTLAYITPPILGTVAFVMAELLAIPYTWVIIMSVGPAVLYALSILLYNEFYSRVNKLTNISKTAISIHREKSGFKRSKRLILDLLIIFLPPATIITLLFKGFTIRQAIFITIVLSLILVAIDKELRENIRSKIYNGLAEGLILLVPVGVSIVLANVIMSTLVLTGLHSKISVMVLEMLGGNLYILILFTFTFALLLGMGVPPLATYILSSLLLAPALIKLLINIGIPEMSATLSTHMFLFYISMLADITPPVALSAFAAAAVFNLDPIKVGIKAALVAIPKYFYVLSFLWSFWGMSLLILPVALVSDPAHSFFYISSRFILTIIAILLISIANAGGLIYRINMTIRLLLAIFGMMILIPTTETTIIGMIGGTALLIYIYKNRTKYQSV